MEVNAMGEASERISGENRPDRIIYVGPSLYNVAIEHLPGELWRPPAGQGDILRAAIEKPKQIVLIDGVFHQQLAVWHKELVYALLEGVVCIGASSMGALRAAELHRYGMIGIGKIFEMYRDGEEDDSLVAMTFDAESCRPILEAPVGQQQKSLDALEAIRWSRNHAYEECITTLDKSSISPYLQRVVTLILEDKKHG
jgi:hypothetical protein